MGVDEVREAAPTVGEGLGTAERLRIKGGEVVHVLGPAITEQWLQNQVGEHVAVQGVDELVDRRLSAGEVAQRRLVPLGVDRPGCKSPGVELPIRTSSPNTATP